MDAQFFELLQQNAAKDLGSAVQTVNGKEVKTPVRNVDADTPVVDGQAYRIQGFNAPEVANIKAGVFVPGRVRDDTTQADVNTIARTAGMTDLKTTGRDVYNRVLAQQVNPETGARLGDLLVRTGYVKPSRDTPNEVVQGAIQTQAANRMFGSEDPVMKLVEQSAMPDVEYAAKIYVPTAADYANFKNMAGVGAASKETKEAERLENILKTEKLNDSTRARLEGQLEQVKKNIYLASTLPDAVGGVIAQQGDRNIMNESYNQFSDSLKNGILEAQKGLYGALQMGGDKAGWEWLSKYATDNVKLKQLEQGGIAKTISSISDIDNRGGWGTISDTATYAGNLIGGTLPMMAVMVSSAVATGGGALAGIPAAVIYSGGFYADQEDGKKNAGLATVAGIAAGTLDQLGLKGIMSGTDLFTLSGKALAIDALMQTGKYAAKKDAVEALEAATKKEILELTNFGTDFAKRQYATKEAMARGMLNMTGKAGLEAGTETLQTAAEVLAKNSEWNLDFQYDRGFAQSLIDSAIGGGLMGAGFSSVGQVKDAAQWHSIVSGEQAFNGAMAEAQQYQAAYLNDLKDRYGDPNTIATAAKGASAIMKPTNVKDKWFDSLDDLPKAEGAWNSLKAIISSPGRLLRQHAHSAIPNIVGEDGAPKKNLGILKAIMGGYGILPGDHYSAAKQRQMGRWAGNTAEELASAMRTSVKDADQAVRQAWINTWSKGERIEGVNPRDLALQDWKDRLDALQRTMYMDVTSAGVDARELLSTNALLESSSVDPKTLARKRAIVEQVLMDNGVELRTAKETVDELLSGNPERVANARNFAAENGVFRDNRVKDVFENNIFTSIENLKDMLSTRLVGEKYLGPEGKTLANLINKAYQEGEITTEQLPVLSKDVKDWYDMVQGNYHPLDKHPKLQKVLAWGTTLTMMAFLGKATLSSMVEVATSTLGTPSHLIKKQIANFGDSFLKEIRSDINKMNSATLSHLANAHIERTLPSDKIREKIAKLTAEGMADSTTDARALKIKEELADTYEKLAGRTLFEALGYNETGFNTQSKFEYADSNMRDAMHVFATIIGLRAQTDSLRMAALSVSSDIALGKLANLMAIPKDQRQLAFASGEGLNNQQAQDLKELQSWGLDVSYVLDSLPDVITMLREDNLQSVKLERSDLTNHIFSALGNMVDAKVMNPQAFNLPKYFNDPRLRILTAMQRFMATAHAVLLPRLYLDYIKDGNAGMRYQAFSVMASALIMAFLMNGLKDMISYGEDSPYVQGVMKNTQRAVFSSGMTGQFERVIDAMNPLYERTIASPTKEPGKFLWDVAKGASPVLSWSDRPIRAALGLAEGNYEQAVRQGLRGAPVAGSFPIVADVVSSQLKE